MTAADLVLRNGAVHALAAPGDGADPDGDAVVVRDGRVQRVTSDYEARFAIDAGTRVVDLDGRVVLPGFVDAHTHLAAVGRYAVHADLRDAADREDCLAALRGEAADGTGWVLGYGFDESTWPDSRLPDREALDRVSTERPVVAFREDMHTAAVNSVALAEHGDALPDGDVRTRNGTPTGVVVEDAVEALTRATAPDREGTRELLTAARDVAHRRGVTAVHDMVRHSHAPAVYRDLDRAGDLALRVRLNYWSDHLDAAEEVGLRTGHGSAFVRTGAIKTFTDGSIGGRTAKLSEPYADADTAGRWVVPPADLRDLVARADAAGYQVAAHAIGDEAVEAALSAFEATGRAGERRHRLEHAELATREHVERVADAGVVASMQPNFLKWAGEDGLYEAALGPERTRASNRFAAHRDRGVRLAFGSDCMPLDPLLGVHHAVNAPHAGQRLDVTAALRAYTSGAAYAGGDEDRMGTIEPGKHADLVVLEASPWERAGEIRDVDVATTVVDGDVVYDARDDRAGDLPGDGPDALSSAESGHPPGDA